MASAEDGELALLDRVLFKMGMAETDAALEEAVNKFLTPSLLKVRCTVTIALCEPFSCHLLHIAYLNTIISPNIDTIQCVEHC